jgi:hypothetical protein
MVCRDAANQNLWFAAADLPAVCRAAVPGYGRGAPGTPSKVYTLVYTAVSRRYLGIPSGSAWRLTPFLKLTLK